MKTGDITLVYKTILSLPLNSGLIMDSNEQSVSIVKREDERGIYYSINDIINKIPQKVEHDECAMTLILNNINRFKYSVYKSRICNFK